jgi:hypothetical protein
MSDIELPLGGVEAEVTSAALAHYAGFLAECAAIGGDAAAVDEAIRPIVTRLSLRLADLMYPEPEQADPITAAKAIRDAHDPECDCHQLNREADRLGHYPADISYHDYQAAR